MVIAATDRKTGAIVLAAGSSRRFGSTKQLATLDGTALVKRAADTAYDVCGDRMALVVGHDWQAVRNACTPWHGFLLVNEQFASGIASSLAQAVKALQHVTDAIVVLLADQPLITASHLRRLIDTWSGADDEIVATAFDDTEGPPALFPRQCFADLITLTGDEGARRLFTDNRFNLKSVKFVAAAIDIDRPQDLIDLR